MGRVATINFQVFAHKKQLTEGSNDEVVLVNLSMGLYKTTVKNKESWAIEWFDNTELELAITRSTMRSHRISIDPVIKAACVALEKKGIHWEDVRGWGPFFRKQPSTVMPIREMVR